MKIKEKNRYLKADPLEFLLESSDPFIRYKTLKELYNNEGEREYNAMIKSFFIQNVLLKNLSKTIKKKHLSDILNRGSVWFFNLAAFFHLDKRTEVISHTADFLTKNFQQPDGGFSINWNPAKPVACRTGDMVYSLITTKTCDEAAFRGLEWIKSHQRHDGGWLHCPLEDSCDMIKLALLKKSGKGIRREENTSVSSCIYATASCLKALIAANEENEQIHRGMDFFLRRSLHKTRIPPRKSWNRGFLMPGIPVISQYDIIMGLDFAAQTGYFDNHRTSAAFNTIMNKQNKNGTWDCEQYSPGMMQKNQLSSEQFTKLTTLRILHILLKGGMYRIPDISDAAP